MKTPFLVTMCLLTILLSCGSDKEEIEDKGNVIQEEEGEENEGFYEANLIPLNTEIAGSTVGHFRIRIQGDEVRVRGEVQNSPHGLHRQFIHTGPDCPGPGADTNLDGVVSFNESLLITGLILIPLQPFPVAGALGNYVYMRRRSLAGMVVSLRAENRLPPGEELNLAGRTIVIYGINGNINFPVACGTLIRREF